jgi:hypothetical protein
MIDSYLIIRHMVKYCPLNLELVPKKGISFRSFGLIFGLKHPHR